jgi:hypothetical protein
MAFATGYWARLLFISRELSMATCAHPMVCLLQGSFSRVQVRLEAKAGLILMTGGTLNALCIFFKFRLVHNVLTTLKQVVTIAALDFGINMLHVRKGHRWSATISEYRLVIQ